MRFLWLFVLLCYVHICLKSKQLWIKSVLQIQMKPFLEAYSLGFCANQAHSLKQSIHDNLKVVACRWRPWAIRTISASLTLWQNDGGSCHNTLRRLKIILNLLLQTSNSLGLQLCCHLPDAWCRFPLQRATQNDFGIEYIFTIRLNMMTKSSSFGSINHKAWIQFKFVNAIWQFTRCCFIWCHRFKTTACFELWLCFFIN